MNEESYNPASDASDSLSMGDFAAALNIVNEAYFFGHKSLDLKVAEGNAHFLLGNMNSGKKAFDEARALYVQQGGYSTNVDDFINKTYRDLAKILTNHGKSDAAFEALVRSGFKKTRLLAQEFTKNNYGTADQHAVFAIRIFKGVDPYPEGGKPRRLMLKEAYDHAQKARELSGSDVSKKTAFALYITDDIIDEGCNVLPDDVDKNNPNGSWFMPELSNN